MRKTKTKTKRSKKPVQVSFMPKPSRQHGGSLNVHKRRSYRNMNPKFSLHITLKSKHAMGPRSLFRHKKMILNIMRKAALKFNVKVYAYAFAGNHLHLHVKGMNREGIQNFFRVFAGHVAQSILRLFPLDSKRGGALEPENRTKKGKAYCLKNQRRFWQFLTYSRIVTWGREFKVVMNYIEKNVLETLQIIAYEPRSWQKKKNSS